MTNSTPSQSLKIQSKLLLILLTTVNSNQITNFSSKSMILEPEKKCSEMIPKLKSPFLMKISQEDLVLKSKILKFLNLKNVSILRSKEKMDQVVKLAALSELLLCLESKRMIPPLKTFITNQKLKLLFSKLEKVKKLLDLNFSPVTTQLKLSMMKKILTKKFRTKCSKSLWKAHNQKVFKCQRRETVSLPSFSIKKNNWKWRTITLTLDFSWINKISLGVNNS